MKRIVKNVSEMGALAYDLAKNLKGGDILALSGDLGAGKTTFVKSLATALGIEKVITSPTFTVMKKYDISYGHAKTFIHIDCYRLTSLVDAASVGISEILSDDSTIIAIEWPEIIEQILPTERTRYLNFVYVDENVREVTY